MFGRRRELSQAFDATTVELWRALAAALPCLTQQATWYEQARRVEWVVDATGSSWTQKMTASVESPSGGSAVLHFSGKSPYRAAIGDAGRRRQAFQTLTHAVTEALEHQLTLPVEDHVNDEFRWWNGQAWTVDPRPPPPRLPS